jgi:hypothetical protein
MVFAELLWSFRELNTDIIFPHPRENINLWSLPWLALLFVYLTLKHAVHSYNTEGMFNIHLRHC